MKITHRITALAALGERLEKLEPEQINTLASRAGQENAWFTQDHVSLALQGITRNLKKNTLEKWIAAYTFSPPQKTIALVLAGNIPFVGFHDVLCVLLSGHKALIKPSSKDQIILRYFLDELTAIEPRFASQFEIVERLKDFDAVIATGSDNASRYFNQYFAKYPHIIRKNRSSLAILTGFETPEELTALGKDVFTYFGLGCRNVSKLFLPQGYEIPHLLDQWEIYQPIIHHHKYCNNYDYQKALLMINQVPYYDNGFVLLTESNQLVSPISVLFYETYSSDEELKQKLAQIEDKIQCKVGHHSLGEIPIGKAQMTDVDDYADRIDTLQFLEGLT